MKQSVYCDNQNVAQLKRTGSVGFYKYSIVEPGLSNATYFYLEVKTYRSQNFE